MKKTKLFSGLVDKLEKKAMNKKAQIEKLQYLGLIYFNMSSFDGDVVYPQGKWFPAEHYRACSTETLERCRTIRGNHLNHRTVRSLLLRINVPARHPAKFHQLAFPSQNARPPRMHASTRNSRTENRALDSSDGFRFARRTWIRRARWLDGAIRNPRQDADYDTPFCGNWRYHYNSVRIRGRPHLVQSVMPNRHILKSCRKDCHFQK